MEMRWHTIAASTCWIIVKIKALCRHPADLSFLERCKSKGAFDKYPKELNMYANAIGKQFQICTHC